MEDERATGAIRLAAMTEAGDRRLRPRRMETPFKLKPADAPGGRNVSGAPPGESALSGSFHGNMLTSALGASIAASMAAAYGCARLSSGRMSTGVWHVRTKSRVTVNMKSASVRNILVRKVSTISIVISGRRSTSAGPQPFMPLSYMTVGISGPETDRLRQHGGGNTIWCPSQKVPDKGAANAEAQHHELVDAQVIHQTEMVIGV